MAYRHFLFDLDDTLLDFRASERLSFQTMLESFGAYAVSPAMFADYQRENLQLWNDFERRLITKEALKIERFRRTFAPHGIDIDPAEASTRYLECLSETVVLIDDAAMLCEALSALGEVGIITNGIEHVQVRRIEKSGLGRWIRFVATSEACGFAKPDGRFFQYAIDKFSRVSKPETIIVGDRLDADVLGANRFGIDSCWFNPGRVQSDGVAVATFEAATLAEILRALAPD